VKFLESTTRVDDLTDPRSASPLPRFQNSYSSRPTFGPEITWNLTTFVAFLALVLLWAARMYTTWATWGNLSIDSGREMYVPTVLLQGKMLYRDVWYLYGPAGPYLNSYLFRLFGVNMSVLYWAGSLSALTCAVLLFLVGKQVSSWLAGWTAGAVVLMQAFQPGLFCFPLSYSFASVYGCLTACLCLYFVVRAAGSTHWGWVFGAGTAAAASLLFKLEFGMACYPALFFLIAARGLRQRSWKFVLGDVVAILPGITVCGIVIHWMVSIAGAEFITQENIMSWPTSFFMKTYGKMWLERSGFALSGAAFGQAMVRILFSAAIVAETYCLVWWKRIDPRSLYLRMALFLYILAYYVFSLGLQPMGFFSAVFFPRDAALYVSMAALVSWCYFWRRRDSDRIFAITVLLSFSSLLALRILLKMTSDGYPIYYNGPVVLSFLLLVRLVTSKPGRWRRFPFPGELVMCAGCLAVVAIQVPSVNPKSAGYVRLATDRASILISKQVADNYRAAIQFMKEKRSQGEAVLAVPEDTSLYFLSGIDCPTRVFAFTPGVLAPGKMTEQLIHEIELKPVHYLLMSNRTFPEYGVPIFGRDFNQTLGSYFNSHYHRVRLLVPGSQFWELTFVVWERNPEEEQR
jgi:Dolichyl-phosphate-mannose-protein mannosyltransferase